MKLPRKKLTLDEIAIYGAIGLGIDGIIKGGLPWPQTMFESMHGVAVKLHGGLQGCQETLNALVEATRAPNGKVPRWAEAGRFITCAADCCRFGVDYHPLGTGEAPAIQLYAVEPGPFLGEGGFRTIDGRTLKALAHGRDVEQAMRALMETLFAQGRNPTAWRNERTANNDPLELHYNDRIYRLPASGGFEAFIERPTKTQRKGFTFMGKPHKKDIRESEPKGDDPAIYGMKRTPPRMGVFTADGVNNPTVGAIVEFTVPKGGVDPRINGLNETDMAFKVRITRVDAAAVKVGFEYLDGDQKGTLDEVNYFDWNTSWAIYIDQWYIPPEADKRPTVSDTQLSTSNHGAGWIDVCNLPPVGRTYHLGNDEGDVVFDGLDITDSENPCIRAHYATDATNPGLTSFLNGDTEDNISVEDWNVSWGDDPAVSFTDAALTPALSQGEREKDAPASAAAPAVQQSSIVNCQSSIPAVPPQAEDVKLQASAIIVDAGRNSRRDFGVTSGELSLLGEHMAEVGLLQNLVVEIYPDGTIHLLAGERRLRNALSTPGALVPCKAYRNLDERQRWMITAGENSLHKPLNPIEDANEIRVGVDCGVPMAEIAHMRHISMDKLQRRLNLLKLPPAVQEATALGKLKVHCANELTKDGLSDEERTALAESAVKENWSEEQLRAGIAAALDGPGLLDEPGVTGDTPSPAPSQGEGETAAPADDDPSWRMIRLAWLKEPPIPQASLEKLEKIHVETVGDFADLTAGAGTWWWKRAGLSDSQAGEKVEKALEAYWLRAKGKSWAKDRVAPGESVLSMKRIETIATGNQEAVIAALEEATAAELAEVQKRDLMGEWRQTAVEQARTRLEEKAKAAGPAAADDKPSRRLDRAREQARKAPKSKTAEQRHNQAKKDSDAAAAAAKPSISARQPIYKAKVSAAGVIGIDGKGQAYVSLNGQGSSLTLYIDNNPVKVRAHTLMLCLDEPELKKIVAAFDAATDRDRKALNKKSKRR